MYPKTQPRKYIKTNNDKYICKELLNISMMMGVFNTDLSKTDTESPQ